MVSTPVSRETFDGWQMVFGMLWQEGRDDEIVSRIGVPAQKKECTKKSEARSLASEVDK